PSVEHPAAFERLARAGFGLGDLALVMRQYQVFAASVQIERCAEIFHGHRGALDVPSGPARSPRTLPGGLAGLRGLPEREITGVALALVHLDARARQQLVEILGRQPPVRTAAE